MDKISLFGLLIGLVAILGGQVLEGGHVGSLTQPTALLIVLGGTMGAVTSCSVCQRSVRATMDMSPWPQCSEASLGSRRWMSCDRPVPCKAMRGKSRQ